MNTTTMKLLSSVLGLLLIASGSAFVLTAESTVKTIEIKKEPIELLRLNTIKVDSIFKQDSIIIKDIQDSIGIPNLTPSSEFKIDTAELIANPKDLIHYNRYDNHCDLTMLDSLSPYPLWAYITVLLESGYPNDKSPIAKAVNNNFGMKVPYSRCYNLTTRDWDIYPKLRKDRINKCGDTTITHHGWAAFKSPLESARDFALYQNLFVVPRKPNNVTEYLNTLKALNYFTETDVKKGYIKKWFKIYYKICKQLNRHQ